MTDTSRALEGKAATQDRILRAAGVLFVEQGYGSTTIAEVAERSGVSRGAISEIWSYPGTVPDGRLSMCAQILWGWVSQMSSRCAAMCSKARRSLRIR